MEDAKKTTGETKGKKPSMQKQKGAKELTMRKFFLSLQDENDAMIESEKQVADFLERCGLIAEAKITDEDKARALQNRRREHYHNVQSLLRRYRTLSRTYELYKENFANDILDRMQYLKQEDMDIQDITTSAGLFAFLLKRLDIMSVTDEKKFASTYAPFISAGYRIELALNSAESAVKFLAADDPEGCRLIRALYIDGDTRPVVSKLIPQLEYISSSNFYRVKSRAEERLAVIMFGHASNKAELFSILSYLRQQEEGGFLGDSEF